jgi:hypothetical protein
VIRVWSLEWWENPDTVIAQCVEKIVAAEKAAKEEESPVEEEAPREPAATEIPIIDGTGPIIEEETEPSDEDDGKKKQLTQETNSAPTPRSTDDSILS